MTYRSKHALAALDRSTASQEADDQYRATYGTEDIANHLKVLVIIVHIEDIKVRLDVRIHQHPYTNSKSAPTNKLEYWRGLNDIK